MFQTVREMSTDLMNSDEELKSHELALVEIKTVRKSCNDRHL